MSNNFFEAEMLAKILENATAVMRTDGFRYFKIIGDENPRDKVGCAVLTSWGGKADDWEVGMTTHVFNRYCSQFAEDVNKALDGFPLNTWVPFQSAAIGRDWDCV